MDFLFASLDNNSLPDWVYFLNKKILLEEGASS